MALDLPCVFSSVFSCVFSRVFGIATGIIIILCQQIVMMHFQMTLFCKWTLENLAVYVGNKQSPQILQDHFCPPLIYFYPPPCLFVSLS